MKAAFHIHNSLVKVVFFCPLFGFALRHSAFPLFLVQRLVPPNGHRCLNFNFAKGEEKKQKKKTERFIDFWTLPSSCFFISKLAEGEKKKRKKRNGRQFLHASPLKRTTRSCSRTCRADIWGCTLHNSALFPSQRVVVMFESAPPRLWRGCFPSALRVGGVQVRDKNEETRLSVSLTSGYTAKIQLEQVYLYIFLNY